jgi:GTP-sensing pleiotropic transcriptional regulator CodY
VQFSSNTDGTRYKTSKFEGIDRVDASKYRSLVVSLQYLTCRRPDIAYSVGIVSRFMEELDYSHLKAIKRIIRYIRGTENSDYPTRK